MIQITDHLANIDERIDQALAKRHLSRNELLLVAVSKRQSAAAVAAGAAAGLKHFGENYLQEALEKIDAVKELRLEWHFIGQVQSNKTGPIAEHFSWVQTLDRNRIATRLDSQRPDHLAPLNVLIQLNLDKEPQKAGIGADELLPLAEHVASLSRLKLRGVMGMPPAGNSEAENRASFVAIAAEFERLKTSGFDVDTVSMGMSSDFELAIECGSNCIRLGTALFGPRPTD